MAGGGGRPGPGSTKSLCGGLLSAGFVPGGPRPPPPPRRSGLRRGPSPAPLPPAGGLTAFLRPFPGSRVEAGENSACPRLADLTASARGRGRPAGPAMLLWERRRAPPGANHGNPQGGRSRSVASPSPTALLLPQGSPAGTPLPRPWVVSPGRDPAVAGRGQRRGSRGWGCEVGGGRVCVAAREKRVRACSADLQVSTCVSDPPPVAAAAPPSQAGTTRPSGGGAAGMRGRTRLVRASGLLRSSPPPRAGQWHSWGRRRVETAGSGRGSFRSRGAFSPRCLSVAPACSLRLGRWKTKHNFVF